MVWNTFYGGSPANVVKDAQTMHEKIPPWCKITADKNKLRESNAVVFNMYYKDFPIKHGGLPEYRSPDQSWVVYTFEPPSNTPCTEKWEALQFNRTMSYRTDADFLTPYGYVTPRETPLPADWAPWKRKTKMVAWMVGHCKTINKREDLVKKLEK